MHSETLYVNGCSFSCSGGLSMEDVRKYYKDIHDIYINDDNVYDYGYANIVAKNLNLKLVNESVPGGSTNRLIRTTYEYIFRNSKTIDKTLFILELPPGWRDEFYLNILAKTINITGGIIDLPDAGLKELINEYSAKDIKKFHNQLLNYFNNFVDMLFEERKTCNNLVGLLSFIKSKNLKFILIDGIGFTKYLKNHDVDIDEYHFCKFDDNYIMFNWFQENKLTISDELGIEIDGHAGIFCNKKISEIVIEYIQKIT